MNKRQQQQQTNTKKKKRTLVNRTQNEARRDGTEGRVKWNAIWKSN